MLIAVSRRLAASLQASALLLLLIFSQASAGAIPARKGFCATDLLPFPGQSPARLHALGSELPPADSVAEPTQIDTMFLYTSQTVIG
jgi:hypothetical protein